MLSQDSSAVSQRAKVRIIITICYCFLRYCFSKNARDDNSGQRSRCRRCVWLADRRRSFLYWGSPRLFWPNVHIHNLFKQEMSHTFSIKTMWRSFFCALVATVTLSVSKRDCSKKSPFFSWRYSRRWILSGRVSLCFSKSHTIEIGTSSK